MSASVSVFVRGSSRLLNNSIKLLLSLLLSLLKRGAWYTVRSNHLQPVSTVLLLARNSNDYRQLMQYVSRAVLCFYRNSVVQCRNVLALSRIYCSNYFWAENLTKVGPDQLLLLFNSYM